MAFSIAVVDPDAGSGQITQAGIKRALGDQAEVKLSSTPDWSMFQQHAPDVVVFDPTVQSWDNVRIIQRIHEEFPMTRIIVLASAPSLVLRSTMKTLGVAAYLEKPTPISLVVEHVRRMLFHPPTPIHTVLY